MRNNLQWLFLVSLGLILGCSDGEKPTKKDSTPIQKSVQVYERKAPAFIPDSAFAFVKKQVEFGPRVPNTTPHKNCAKYLENQLKKFGVETTVQQATVTAYNNDKLEIYNIIGRMFPEKEKRIMLFAHWDTRHIADRDEDPNNRKTPILGANDGASGVAVILEILRVLNAASVKPNIGVDVVFFDAEDYGQPGDLAIGMKENSWCLGSQYWAKNPPIKNFNPKFGILLDMVGAPDAIFPQEAVSLRYAPQVVNKVWSMAARIGYGDYFTGQIVSGGITDDHLYVNKIAKIPSIDIIHYDATKGDFGHFHHTLKDDLSGIEPATLKVVGDVVLEVIYSE